MSVQDAAASAEVSVRFGSQRKACVPGSGAGKTHVKVGSQLKCLTNLSFPIHSIVCVVTLLQRQSSVNMQWWLPKYVK